jgi:dTDP-4-dehydrorhamnose reductase
MIPRSEKIVLLGAKGMLGSEVYSLLADYNVTALDLPEFDITNKSLLENAVKDANVIINCAAYTDVEKSESQADLAFKVNADAIANLAEFARRKNAYVIHIGTDFVFDGKKDSPYIETDAPSPINVYGKSKLQGELLLAEKHNFYSIIRVQWTYGKNGNNFISKLISLSRQKDCLKVIDDQFGSPTWTMEAAKVICKFVDKKPQGLFHYCAAGFTSRFEMARYVFNYFKLNTEIVPCKTTEFKTAAKRPLNSRFCCDKIQSLLDKPIELWQKPLERFLKTL